MGESEAPGGGGVVFLIENPRRRGGEGGAEGPEGVSPANWGTFGWGGGGLNIFFGAEKIRQDMERRGNRDSFTVWVVSAVLSGRFKRGVTERRYSHLLASTMSTLSLPRDRTGNLTVTQMRHRPPCGRCDIVLSSRSPRKCR